MERLKVIIEEFRHQEIKNKFAQTAYKLIGESYCACDHEKACEAYDYWGYGVRLSDLNTVNCTPSKAVDELLAWLRDEAGFSCGEALEYKKEPDEDDEYDEDEDDDYEDDSALDTSDIHGDFYK